jgi:hypothetical protein
MTIYGTPAGTPLNQTGGFQGTQPGNAVQTTQQPFLPGVGLFPPNSNNLSGDTVQAAMSRAAYPINTYINNEGVGANLTIPAGGPADGGSQASASVGLDFGSASGGGTAGVGGAGGCNMNANAGATGDVILANRAPAANITFQGGGAQPSQYAG